MVQDDNGDNVLLLMTDEYAVAVERRMVRPVCHNARNGQLYCRWALWEWVLEAVEVPWAEGRSIRQSQLLAVRETRVVEMMSERLLVESEAYQSCWYCPVRPEPRQNSRPLL